MFQLFHIAFYQLDVVTLQTEIFGLFMSKPPVFIAYPHACVVSLEQSNTKSTALSVVS